MRNRPDGLEPEGRISRDRLVDDKYEGRTKAEIETLKYYFSEEWFSQNYIRSFNITRGKIKKRTSSYPLQKCPVCLKTWNFYSQNKKRIQYWDNYERLPKPEVICPNC